MSVRKATRRPKAQEVKHVTAQQPSELPECFHELTYDLPLAGTPAPLPCPFCQTVDMVAVSIDSDTHGPNATVECQNCGAEGLTFSISEEAGLHHTFDLVLAACKWWNARKPERKIPSR